MISKARQETCELNGWILITVDLAKEFLAYLYSDEAAAVFAEYGAVQPIKNASEYVKGENKLFYSIYDNGAKAVMGGFAATEVLEGVSIYDAIFSSYNSVVSKDKTIEEWRSDIAKASEKLRKALK